MYRRTFRLLLLLPDSDSPHTVRPGPNQQQEFSVSETVYNAALDVLNAHNKLGVSTLLSLSHSYSSASPLDRPRIPDQNFTQLMNPRQDVLIDNQLGHNYLYTGITPPDAFQ